MCGYKSIVCFLSLHSQMQVLKDSSFLETYTIKISPYAGIAMHDIVAMPLLAISKLNFCATQTAILIPGYNCAFTAHSYNSIVLWSCSS